MPNIQGLPRKEKAMPASKAQQKAVNKYVKANYDLYQIKMPKGKKDNIKNIAAASGESMNQYIINAIGQRMQRDTSTLEALGEPTNDLTTTIQPIPPGTPAAAAAAAETAGESSADFIVRAIQEATEASGISLPPSTIKAAQEAAEAAGEAVPVFIARAVETQAQRDEIGRKMKGGKANE